MRRWIGIVCLAFLMFGAQVNAQSADDVERSSYTSTFDESEMVWWAHLGESSMAVLNLGPLMHTESGKSARWWMLVVHRSGKPDPLSCVQGMLEPDQRYPIEARSGAFSLSVEPRGGKGWVDVQTSEDLVSTVNGLD